MPSQSSFVEPLTTKPPQQRDCIRDKTFKGVIKVKWGHKDRAVIQQN